MSQNNTNPPRLAKPGQGTILIVIDPPKVVGQPPIINWQAEGFQGVDQEHVYYQLLSLLLTVSQMMTGELAMLKMAPKVQEAGGMRLAQ